MYLKHLHQKAEVQLILAGILVILLSLALAKLSGNIMHYFVSEPQNYLVAAISKYYITGKIGILNP